MKDTSEPSIERAAPTDSVTVIDGAQAEAIGLGLAPLKVVTGNQTTSGLSFVLQPGAIVAHNGARVIFVCG